MNLKSLTTSVLVATSLLWTSAAYPSHRGFQEWHVYGAVAYFWSLNFDALIAYLNGKDIKEGSMLEGDVIMLNSDTACANPQGHLISGVGPSGGDISIASDILGEGDALNKKDRQKRNVFNGLASGNLVADEDRLRQDLGICKTSGGTNWAQVFWQFTHCDTGDRSDFGVTCYQDYATFDDGVLTYATGEKSGLPVENDEHWMFVYLPISFAIDAFVTTDGVVQEDSHSYFLCTFKLNEEPGAIQPPEPYGIDNPPADGWGGLAPAEYDCQTILQDEYESYL